MRINSTQPRKQRKFRYTASLHDRQKFLHAHLGREARAKLRTERRSIAVRTGDTVKIMRGKFKGKVGKVSRVDLTHAKVFIEGATFRKAKGQERPAGIDPSNLVITDPDMKDEWRKEIFGRSPKMEAQKAK